MTARRLGPSAWRDDWMPATKETLMDTNPLRSELRSIAAGLLNLRTHLDDDPHDEELRRAAVRLRDLSDGATPRAPQAAGDANVVGDDAGAAHDPHEAAAGRTERCESRHPERGLLCTLPAGHDTHRHVGDAWTTLDRLDGHALVRTGDLAEVLAVASLLVTPGTTSDVIDRLNAALAEAVQEADR